MFERSYMNICKKMLHWEHISYVCSRTQEEDSEEEPKLKYERLSNGVTDILQKDAASCMTVHDKVEVIIHQPQGHFPLKSTYLKHRIHIVYVRIWEMSSSKLVFISPVQSLQAAHSFLTFSCFFLSGRHIRKHQTPLCLPLFIPTLTYFCSSPLLIFFKRATLSKMVNRCGTSSTHARLSRAKVMTSYVSSPDVLLTAIDFHLFIFALRIWSPFFIFNLKIAAVPQWETLLWWNPKFDLTVFLPGISVLVYLLPSSYLCGHTVSLRRGKLLQP